jgi:hypothetical protein
VPLLGGRNARNGGRGERDVEPTAADGYSGGRLIARHLGTVEGRVEEVSQIRKAGKTTRIVVIGDTTGELRLKFSRGHGHAPRAAAAGHRKAAPIPQRTGLYVQPVVLGSRDTGIGLVRKPRGRLDSDNRSAGAIQLTDPTP